MTKIMKSKFNVGGEAVIEGVMMRSPHYYAIAVRRADKKIVTTSAPVNSAADRYKFLKWPLIRGVLAMIESMSLGFKALDYSANIMEEDIQKEEAKKNRGKKQEIKPKSQAVEMTISIILAVMFFIVLFIMVPQGLTRLLGKAVKEFNTKNIAYNLGMVFFKFMIFLLYVWGISFLKDIKRLFQYHGAEHKSIYVFENGAKLNFANTKKYPTKHPRCGTAFIMITIIISLFVFVPLLPPSLKVWQRILYELPLLIPIVGISYELLKLSDKFRTNPVVNILIMPGLAFQNLTTKEPDKHQVEVAIRSLNTVVALENRYLKKHPVKKAKGK
jgi:uncharacterized protein YqhQ